MRVGIIADVHSNAEALESVLDGMQDVEQIWCLGDIIGYGPEPERCIDMIMSRKHVCIIGNHDLCVLEDIDTSDFSREAIATCVWSRGRLDEKHLAYLRELPTKAEPAPGILLVHGSPRKDVFEYVLSSWQADEILSEANESIVFVGHSHVPLVFMKAGDAYVDFISLADGQVFELNRDDVKYLINPGSVGQPRDGNPKASYMVFDTEKYVLEYHRVAYPIKMTQECMELAGLPASLSDRLERGM